MDLFWGRKEINWRLNGAMIYLLNYHRYKPVMIVDASNNFLELIDDRNWIDDNYLSNENRGWFGYYFGRRVSFYRVDRKLFFCAKNKIFELNDRCFFLLKESKIIPRLVRLTIGVEGESDFHFNFLPKRNPFKSFDNTMAQEPEDLDIIHLVRYILSDQARRHRFSKTGYY